MGIYSNVNANGSVGGFAVSASPVLGGIGNTLGVNISTGVGPVTFNADLNANNRGRVVDWSYSIDVDLTQFGGTPLEFGVNFTIVDGQIVATGALEGVYTPDQLETLLRDKIDASTRGIVNAGLDLAVDALLAGLAAAEETVRDFESYSREELNQLLADTFDALGIDADSFGGRFEYVTHSYDLGIVDIDGAGEQFAPNIVTFTSLEFVSYEEAERLQSYEDLLAGLDNLTTLVDIYSAPNQILTLPFMTPPPAVTRTPIIIVTAPDTPTLSFTAANVDINGDGALETTTWFGNQASVLVYNQGGLSEINTNYSLVTMDTVGQAQLLTIDADNDGEIDLVNEGEDRFSSWRDLNNDGAIDTGELFALQDEGYSYITLFNFGEPNAGLSFSDHAASEVYVSGTGGGSVRNTTVNGIVYELESFSSDQLIAVDLPLLGRYFDITSTRAAYLENPDLVDRGYELLNSLETADYNGFIQEFDMFLFEWAGVTDIDPNVASAGIDMRKVAFLELATGVQLIENGEMFPSAEYIDQINAAYDEIKWLELGNVLDQSYDILGHSTLDSSAIFGTAGADLIDASFMDPFGGALTDSNHTILAGDGNDKIYDGAGNDMLFGGNGQDRFFAGGGADSYDGGNHQYDEVAYNTSQTGLTIDMTNAANSTGIAAGDTFVDIERISGSNFDDVIILSGSTAVYNARGGNDIIVDGDGLNALRGGAGADTFRFIAGDGFTDRIHDFTSGEDLVDISAWGVTDFDQLTLSMHSDGNAAIITYGTESVRLDNLSAADMAGLSASDFVFSEDTGPASDGTISGTSGADVINIGYVDLDGDVNTGGDQIIIAGEGNDTIYDGAGDDMLYGGAGQDRFFAGAGADHYDGGDHHYDEVLYSTSQTGLTIDMTNAANSTGIAAGDTYVDIERIRGSNFNDIIILSGNASVYDARSGDDLIIDGDGLNTMRGGAGADTFQFGAGDGFTDQIYDFTSGEDLVDISAWGVTNFNQLTLTMHGNGNAAIISYGNDNVRLDNYSALEMANLSESDFVFT